MRRSFYKIYIHVVWRTKNSEPMINERVFENIRNILKAKCVKFDIQVLAFGNTEDHVHILLSINPNIKISEFIAEVKGASSYFINHQTNNNLHWQDGYGVVSVSESVINSIKRYIENQQEHHIQKNGLIKSFEDMGDE